MYYLGATALSRATFGQGSGQIWLDNVACTSTESRLIECPANNIGSHNCAHSEDAGVRCTAPTCMYIAPVTGYIIFESGHFDFILQPAPKGPSD